MYLSIFNLGSINFFNNSSKPKLTNSVLQSNDTIPIKNNKPIHKMGRNLDTIETYQKLAIKLEEEILQLKQKTEIKKQRLNNIYTYLNQEYNVEGNRAFKERFKNFTFDCYEVADSSFSKIRLFLNNDNGLPISSLSNLNAYLKSKNELLVFSTNGGMFTPEYKPVGLFIQNNVVLNEIDRREGLYGNFYLQPNGVFYIDTCQEAGIVNTKEIDMEAINKFKYATQSGPMLLHNGKINSNFKEGSTNVNIRNGVGMSKKGNLLFVISNEKVNFYDFAMLFKEVLGCDNALYLDGAISEAYIPELGRLKKDGLFGPLIGIIKWNFNIWVNFF